MGGFSSRHVTNSADEVARPSSSREENVEPNPQAFIASFDPADPASRSLAVSSQSSQAPRQKQQASSSSLHVNRRVISETLAGSEWEGLGGADVALAEEEEMQLAIAMSASITEQRSREASQCPCSSGGSHSSHAGPVDSSHRIPPMHVGAGGSLYQGVGKHPPEKDRPLPIAGKGLGLRPPDELGHKAAHHAAGLGLPGDYAWVDNSDFHSPRKNQLIAEKAASKPKQRSASAGARGRLPISLSSSSSNSGIVSLPRIGQTTTDQQAMVKDLHENISLFSPDDEECPRGPLAKNAKADVRRVLQDLNMEPEPQTISRGKRGYSVDKEHQNELFNERFHSCSEAPRSDHPHSVPSPSRKDRSSSER